MVSGQHRGCRLLRRPRHGQGGNRRRTRGLFRREPDVQERGCSSRGRSPGRLGLGGGRDRLPLPRTRATARRKERAEQRRARRRSLGRASWVACGRGGPPDDRQRAQAIRAGRDDALWQPRTAHRRLGGCRGSDCPVWPRRRGPRLRRAGARADRPVDYPVLAALLDRSSRSGGSGTSRAGPSGRGLLRLSPRSTDEACCGDRAAPYRDPRPRRPRRRGGHPAGSSDPPDARKRARDRARRRLPLRPVGGALHRDRKRPGHAGLRRHARDDLRWRAPADVQPRRDQREP